MLKLCYVLSRVRINLWHGLQAVRAFLAAAKAFGMRTELLAAAYLEQLDLKDQRGTAGNHRRVTILPISN